MAMWEIDVLLKSSIRLVEQSAMHTNKKKHLIWNLEQLPERYEFDAGGFEKSALDSNFEYKVIHPYELGLIISREAKRQNTPHFIYDWSAFLLNYWNQYFASLDALENLKSTYLEPMKALYHSFDFGAYEPIHASLTVYEKDQEWFEEEQNALIRWYCA